MALLGTCAAQQPSAANRISTSQRNSSRPAPGQLNFESHCASCHGLDGRGGEHAHAIATPHAAGALEDVAIYQIIRGGIPSAGMPSFRSLSEPELHAIVTYLRLLTGKAAAPSGTGNAARGEQVFFGKGRCGDCHMMLGKGGPVGSDLTDFAGSHSANELHQAIIHPDQWISPAQNVVTVTTLSEERFSGLVRNEDNFSLQLQDANGTFHLFMKSQIAKVDRDAHSLMPGDYGTRLTPAELDDLIRYLASGLRHSTIGLPGGGRSAQKMPDESDSK